MSLETDGLDEAVLYLSRLAAGLQPSGEMGAIVAEATLRAHRYATKIVHFKTGRLRNSLYPSIHKSQGNNAYGMVGTNVAYAQIEHERTVITGKERPPGGHAFFRRTVDEEGPNIIQDAEKKIARLIKKP